MYNVVITREDDAWLADVPDVPGAHTFARSLPSLLRSVHEVIVLMDDLEEDAAIDLTLDYQIDDDTVSAAVAAAHKRKELQALEKETAELAHRLKRRGYSVRDSGILLGVTPGRISQLTNA